MYRTFPSSMSLLSSRTIISGFPVAIAQVTGPGLSKLYTNFPYVMYCTKYIHADILSENDSILLNLNLFMTISTHANNLLCLILLAMPEKHNYNNFFGP